MKKSIRKERFYPASPQAVWAALTNADALSQWFMVADFQPKVGYQFRFQDEPRGKWDGILTGEVLVVTELTLLEYTWMGSQMSSITNVKWELQPQSEGTLLQLEHTGFEGFGDVVIGFFHQFGWQTYLSQLATYLENGV